MKLELISVILCPYVQGSVIVLLEKKVDFIVTYIDLAKPPRWFRDIAPLGRVPALRVGNDALFESSVISEYLDDITPPSMHPADPLERATNKAWITFASEMLAMQTRYFKAATEDEFDLALAGLERRIAQLEARLDRGPFFNGDRFCLIDAAYAPFFTRAAVLESLIDNKLYESAPKVERWAGNLICRESVIDSVEPGFEKRFLDYITGGDTYAGKLFKQARNKTK